MKSVFRRAQLLTGLICCGIQGTVATSLCGEEHLPLSADMSAFYGSVGAAESRIGRFVPLAPSDVVLRSAGATSGEKQRAAIIAPPAYVVLAAELANWDADSEPDGWRCQIQIRDQSDRPATPLTSYATFELRLRVPRRDRNGFEDLKKESVRWSQRLEVDNAGIASVKLPLRTRLPGFSAGTAFGIMSVRVSIPGVGVLAAVDPVLADEPLLVDSNWPQR